MSNRGDPIWVFWLSLVGLIGAFVGGIVVLGRVMDSMDFAKMAEDENDRAILSDPETGDVARAMRDGFPGEYAGLKAIILDAQRMGNTPEAIDKRIHEYAWNAMGRHLLETVQAPHDAFARYRSAEQKLLERLGMIGAEPCAEYAINWTVTEPLDDGEALRLRIAADVAYWEAARAALRPANRETSALSNGDAVAFDDAMIAAGMSQADLRALNQIGEMAADRQCNLGLQRMRAIGRLPDDSGDRVFGALLTGAI